MISDNLIFFENLFETDSYGREINIYRIENVIPTGLSFFYPNIKFMDEKNVIYNPINEMVMSLKSIKLNEKYHSEYIFPEKEVSEPVFFFIYNTDNYYHYIYDTLPYLISFFHLKKEIKNLKLLMNYPNEFKNSFYSFVTEFLDILNISKNDIILIDEKTKYNEIYISSSYTHGINSNLPPRKEIYDFFNSISEKVDIQTTTPKKIYISRRSWLHGDFTNMGTNYTNRRKMVNEDELVEFLVGLGFTEVFTEKMTTSEKINLFKNCETIIGPIGGGLCNVLFSKPTTKLIPIISPFFLDINERFLYSFSNVNVSLFKDTEHIESSEFKNFMRVKCGNIVGEIINKKINQLEIIYNDSPVAGWNHDGEYKKVIVDSSSCQKLDNGLNSSFKLDMNKFKKLFEL